jgi:tetratricopeptide (TPR) repeat protein
VDTTDITQLRQAVQTAPQDREARLALLQALVTHEVWQEARDVGSTLLQEASPPPSVHALMSLAYAGCAQADKAIEQGRLALEQQPDDALLPFNLGTLLSRQGKLEAALEWLEKAVRQHETWPEAQYNLGTVLLHLERYHEALDAFERALEQRDSYPEAHFNRGNAHALLGLDPDGNLDYYELDCAINAYKAGLHGRPVQSGHGIRPFDLLRRTSGLGSIPRSRRPPARRRALASQSAGVQAGPAGPLELAAWTRAAQQPLQPERCRDARGREDRSSSLIP